MCGYSSFGCFLCSVCKSYPIVWYHIEILMCIALAETSQIYYLEQIWPHLVLKNLDFFWPQCFNRESFTRIIQLYLVVVVKLFLKLEISISWLKGHKGMSCSVFTARALRRALVMLFSTFCFRESEAFKVTIHFTPNEPLPILLCYASIVQRPNPSELV